MNRDTLHQYTRSKRIYTVSWIPHNDSLIRFTTFGRRKAYFHDLVSPLDPDPSNEETSIIQHGDTTMSWLSFFEDMVL